MHSRRKPPGQLGVLEVLRDTPPWEWPRNAGPRLKDILRNGSLDAASRLEAVGFAGALVVMNDDMAAALLDVVRNSGEPAELRGQAAITLGPALEEVDTSGFEDDFTSPAITEKAFLRIQEALHQTYLDESQPKVVRRYVLEASVRSPSDWHSDAVRTAAASPDEEWKLTAAFCMRWIRGFDDSIMEFLDSPNPDIHYEAVRAADENTLERAWPHVSSLLSDETTGKKLLLAAIGAAASIQPLEASAILIRLADSEDHDIAEAASDALAMSRMDTDDEEDDDDLFGDDPFGHAKLVN
jgi:hypothetical protein